MALWAAALAMPGLAKESANAQRSRMAAAAAADASEALRRQVLEASFSDGQTVQDVARQLGAEDAVTKAIQSAGQRGGPRSQEGQTCEVRLELPGSAIADALAQVPQSKQIGISARAFADGLTRLRRQTFSALGVSTAAGNLTRLRADGSPAWRMVPEAARVEALNAARTNAIAHVLESLRAVPMAGGRTTDDALAIPAVADRLRDWLGAQPITGVEFDESLEVRLKLAVPPGELWLEFRQALVANHVGPAIDAAADWNRLRDGVTQNVAPAIGRGVATAPVVAPAAMAPRPDVLPAVPPRWVAGQLDADGESAVAGLKGAREAEAIALGKLRRQVETLALKPGFSVADVTKDDPRVARAIDDGLRQAKVVRVTYLPKNVSVRVTLDLELFWRSLSSSRP